MTNCTNLKIEDIDVKEWYTLTISPDDNHQYWEITDYKDRLLKFVDNQRIQINRILQPCRYELYMEVSPLGRLHWHGIIRYNDIETMKRFYVTQIHKLRKGATFEIDNIKDEEIWNTYKKKQSKIWSIKITSEDKISKLALMDVTTEVTYKKIPLE